MKKKYFYLVSPALIFFLACSVCTNAQLKADFTSLANTGCAPFAVQFTDASSGNPTEWDWDFGNGTTSTLQNPAAAYIAPGTYTVSLTVKNGAAQDAITKTAYVTVHANPEIDFTAFPRIGCVPFNVNFLDSSSAGSGVLTDWLWDFGDGSISRLQNPSHTYLTVNIFNVTLTLRNSFGCQQTVTEDAYVTTKPGVQADFVYKYNDACTSPVNVSFVNNSASTDPMYYQWYFGDGGASTATSPAHTYNLPGSYKITLVSKAQTTACNDTLSKIITIGSPSADFNIPASICLNAPALFTDNSSPRPLSVRWDFGDGTLGNGPSVSHTYTNNGTYLVKMTADFGSCRPTQEKQIVVNGNAQANFTASGNLQSCALPQSINFTNQSVGAVRYQWNFGDGSVSNTDNPVHVYNLPGDYAVTLIAINPSGCSDTIVKNKLVSLHPVQINGLRNLPFQSCAPKTISFDPLISTQDPVVSYQWAFGDGGSSNLANPKHTYSNTGSYTVSLSVTTQTGCKDTFILGNAVALGKRPIVDFSAAPLDACASTTINFTDLSKGTITSWLWYFGDSLATSSSTDQNPKHKYLDTGHFSIKLVVSANGCADSLTRNNYVHIKPPVGSFSFRVDCSDYLNVNFINTSIGARTYSWNFGDGGTSTVRSPPHSYAATGSYKVTLTVFNANGCSYTKDSVINIIGKNGQLAHKPPGDFCKYDTVKFYLENYDPKFITYVNWNFGDSSATGPNGRTDSIYHIYSAAGNFSPYLIVRNIYTCYDTVYSQSTVNVFGPAASFLVDPDACQDSTVTFNDLSVPYLNYPITSWQWDFGDGVISTYNGPPYIHAYTSPGVYSVKLKVADSKGCYDTALFLNAIQISKSDLDAGTDTAICPGNTIVLQPSGADIYTWQQNNSLSCTNCTNPSANPNTTTVYYVSGTNGNGCTSTDSVVVDVQAPITLQVNNADTSCVGETTQLSASGAELYTWIPSDGSQTLYGAAISVAPSANVVYTVIGTDSLGCFSDTSQLKLQVYPYPVVSFPVDPVTINAGSQYQMQPTISADATQFLWTPLAGLNCMTCRAPTATPKATTTYKLQATNTGGCSAIADITIQVVCKNEQIFIPNTFSPNHDGVNDVFFPRGQGIFAIRAFRVFNRLGQMVFERKNVTANDAANGWDGTYQGKVLNADVYVYDIEVVCENNQVLPFKGNITLLR